MNIKQLFSRLIWYPFGFVKGIIELTNEKARDFENKKRFPNAIIEKNCSFNTNVIIGKNSRICYNTTVNDSQIGFCTYINYNSLIQHTEIGNYCSIAHGVKMGLGEHPLHLTSTSPLFYKVNNALNISLIEKDIDFNPHEPIKIGSDVWVGAQSIIMNGVTIGHGAVVAAGSIVTKEVLPYNIVAGIPAKVINTRFNQNKIDELLNSKWWLKEPLEINNTKNKFY